MPQWLAGLREAAGQRLLPCACSQGKSSPRSSHTLCPKTTNLLKFGANSSSGSQGDGHAIHMCSCKGVQGSGVTGSCPGGQQAGKSRLFPHQWRVEMLKGGQGSES